MLNAITTTRDRSLGDDRMPTLARWLARQRAVPTSLAESTAWRILEAAMQGAFALSGPKAPLIVQPRFSLWLVGQLGGRPIMHVFVDEAAAGAKARQLGQAMRVPVLLIDRGGEIVERIDRVKSPARPTALSSSPVPFVARSPAPNAGPPVVAEPTVLPRTPATEPPLVLAVARHLDRWAVFLEGRLIATAPTRERARMRARALKADPDFTNDPRRVADE